MNRLLVGLVLLAAGGLRAPDGVHRAGAGRRASSDRWRPEWLRRRSVGETPRTPLRPARPARAPIPTLPAIAPAVLELRRPVPARRSPVDPALVRQRGRATRYRSGGRRSSIPRRGPSTPSTCLTSLCSGGGEALVRPRSGFASPLTPGQTPFELFVPHAAPMGGATMSYELDASYQVPDRRSGVTSPGPTPARRYGSP